MNKYYFWLTCFFSLLLEASGHSSDNIEERIDPTARIAREQPKGRAPTLEELVPRRDSSLSVVLREPLRQAGSTNNIISPEEQEQDIDHGESPKYGTQNEKDCFDKKLFYEQYGVNPIFQSHVQLKFSRDEATPSGIKYSVVNLVWRLFFMQQFEKLEEKIKQRDHIIKQLEDSGKSISEIFFLKENYYKEKIRLLEETIEKGKGGFQQLKNIREEALEDKNKTIHMLKQLLQGKSDLEEKTLKKTLDILKLLKVDEVEHNILLNLDLIEKQLSTTKQSG